MAENPGDKDQLRAEFAMSARRLEMSVDQLKNKTTASSAETGRIRCDQSHEARARRKNATILCARSAREGDQEQLRATEEEFGTKTAIGAQREQALPTSKTTLRN